MSLLLARDKLSPNNLEAGLPGREAHSDELYNFLFERLKIRRTAENKRAKVETGQVADIKGRHMNKTMFVCGVPGTGKTATILSTINKMNKLLSQKSPPIHPFQSIYINGQLLASPGRIYSEILFKLSQENCAPERAQEKLDKIFRDNSIYKPDSRGKKKKTKNVANNYKIVIIDELDLLYSDKRQAIFYNLFDWPTTSDSKMILIAIANAMDLPERFIRGRISSRLGWDKLVFESYTSTCLERILRSRLGKDLLNETFEKSAVLVATKRIGRTTGDARRILDTCRLAIDKAIELNVPKVTPAIIDQVGFQNLSIQRLDYISSCRVLELFILKSILRECASVGDENVQANGVYTQLSNLLMNCDKLKSYVVGMDEYTSILFKLAAQGLIYLESDKPVITKKIFLKDTSEAFCDLIQNQSANL